MKNNLFLILKVLVLLVHVNLCFGQRTDNALDFNLSYNYSSPLGVKKITKEINELLMYEEPLLLPNMNATSSFALSLIYKPKSFYTVGLKYKSGEKYAKWNPIGFEKHTKSSLKINSLSMQWGIKLPIEKLSFLKNCRLVNYYTPGVFNITYITGAGQYEIPNITVLDDSEQPAKLLVTESYQKEKYYSPGIETSFYFEYLTNRPVGLFCEYSFEIVKTNSLLYLDEYFSTTNLYVGISLKLEKNKRFYNWD